MRTRLGPIVACLVFFVSLAPCSNVSSQEKVGDPIEIGGLFDITGPTNTIGAPFARGAKDYFSFINGKGGIGGKKIDLISIDYQYNAQQSVAGLTRLTTTQRIVGLIGWGSVDLPLLKPKVNELLLPTISAAARGQDVIGEFAPAIFAIAGTYADEILTLMTWAQADAKTRGVAKPKAALLFTEPGRADHAKLKELQAFEKMGFDLVAEEFISVKAVSAASQMARIKSLNPDYVMGLLTVEPASLVLKEAKQLGMDVTCCFNFFSANEVLLQIVGDAAKRLIVSSPVVYYNETDVAGIKIMHELTKEKYLPVQYVAGWVGAMVLAEGIKRANLNPQMPLENARKAILQSIETFKNVEMDGLTIPMTFTSKNHIGTSGFKLYKTDIDKKVFVPLPGRYDVPDFAKR